MTSMFEIKHLSDDRHLAFNIFSDNVSLEVKNKKKKTINPMNITYLNFLICQDTHMKNINVSEKLWVN